MKSKITIILLAILSLSLNLFAANDPDSMYIHFTASDASDSVVVHALADVDSIVYYAPVLPIAPQGIDWDTATEGVALANALTDAEGNSYSAVKIGTQVWMAENLACASGTYIADSSNWSADKAYCYYNNNANGEKATYGAIYTYAAALSACPAGWHLPSDAEWKTLEMELGMSQSHANDIEWRGSNEGSQLAGNSDLWNNGSLENNFEFGTSGFVALPSGGRNRWGTFYSQGDSGNWWSSTEVASFYAFSRRLEFNYSAVRRYEYEKSFGFSVRCIKD